MSIGRLAAILNVDVKTVIHFLVKPQLTQSEISFLMLKARNVKELENLRKVNQMIKELK